MKDNTCCKSDCSTDDIAKVMSNALETQFDLAGKVIGFFAGATSKLIRDVAGQTPALTAGSCCDIPEPCWMPNEVGQAHCQLCHCGQGTVRLRVINTDIHARTFHVVAAGEAASQVSFDLPTFVLGPKERRVVTATFSAPEKKSCCPEELETLIWVMGCRKHYLRWVVDVGDQGRPCRHEYEVSDGPDYVLHWYDHFYCSRSCSRQSIPQRTKK